VAVAEALEVLAFGGEPFDRDQERSDSSRSSA